MTQTLGKGPVSGLIAVFVMAFGPVACTSKSIPSEKPKGPAPRVFALAYPTYFLAQEVGGDAVRVVDVRPEHDDPEYWIPTSQNIFTIQEGAQVLFVGGGFEPWFRKENFSPFLAFKIVDVLGPDVIIDASGSTNPFVWLEPEAFGVAALALGDRLAGAYPENADDFRKRAQAAVEKFSDLERELKAMSERVPPLFGARTGYAYAARALGWSFEYLAADATRAPTEQELKQWQDRKAAFPARHILFEKEVSPEVRRGLASVGLEPVVFPLLTHRSATDREAGRTYFELYRAQVKHLVESVKPSPDSVKPQP